MDCQTRVSFASQVWVQRLGLAIGSPFGCAGCLSWSALKERTLSSRIKNPSVGRLGFGGWCRRLGTPNCMRGHRNPWVAHPWSNVCVALLLRLTTCAGWMTGTSGAAPDLAIPVARIDIHFWLGAHGLHHEAGFSAGCMVCLRSCDGPHERMLGEALVLDGRMDDAVGTYWRVFGGS